MAIQDWGYYSHFICGETTFREFIQFIQLVQITSLHAFIKIPLLVSSFCCNFTLIQIYWGLWHLDYDIISKSLAKPLVNLHSSDGFIHTAHLYGHILIL